MQVLNIVLTAFHVIFSIGLIAGVLLQSGKSAGLSGAITGGAQTLFGKRKGMDDLLAKVTTVFAVAFMLTAIGLTFLSARG